jgi:kynurenine formamidase
MSSPPSPQSSPQSPDLGPATPPTIPLEGLGTESVIAAAQLIRTGRTYDLDCGRWPSMPQWDGHAPFQVLTYRTPRGVRVQKDWDWLGANTVNFGIHSELLSGSAHTGTHIDALCHATCGADDHWFGGSTPEEHLGDFGPRTHDAAAIPPIFTRGVLLDVAGALGVEALPASTEIGAAEIERTLSAQGSEIRPGDVAVIRTGYLSAWPDRERLAEYADAGINLEAATMLMDAGVVALAGDTESLECLPSPDPESPHPVHLAALIERGVFILEMVYLEELARDRVYEFAFACLPLKISGATGSWVRPLALC